MCTMCLFSTTGQTSGLAHGGYGNTNSLIILDQPEDDSSASIVSGRFQGTDANEIGDAAANTSTTTSMEVGERLGGELSSSSDEDWISIDLVAGENYNFTVYGTNGSLAGLKDTNLTLYDSNGNQIATHDNIYVNPQGGSNLFSLIEYTATTTGTYYLAVDTKVQDSGDYIVTATTDDYTVQQVAAEITEINWGFSTDLHHDEQTGSTMDVNISQLTADGQKLALWALEAWSETLGITFNTTTSTNVDIMFDDNRPGAFAGPSSLNPVNGVISTSIVNVSTSWLNTYGTTYDSYSYLTYLHEIGHALGLGHAGHYDGSGSYGTSNHYNNDSYQMTVMSYWGIDEAGLGDSAIPVTPMIADVYAVWGLYGKPASVRAGDTVWGANSNVTGTLGTLMGYLFDGDTVDSNVYGGGHIALTITDTDGHDTLDLSTVTVAQVIDITEGGVSDVNGREGNVVVSLGTVIEEVIGGTAADRITGNAANNTINGGGGDDVIDGGDGTDIAVIALASSDLTVTELVSGAIQVVSSLGTALYTSIETFRLTDGDFAAADLLSSDPNQTLTGTPGADTLTGAGGNDVITGLAGQDTLTGNGGNDSIYGGSWADTLYGGAGADYLAGGDADDVIDGGIGEDTIFGGTGRDEITGGEGNDTVDAGFWSDTIYGGAGNDSLFGNAGDDQIYGGIGTDTIDGGGSNDRIYGGDENDSLNGGLGRDTIWGDDGDDLINADGWSDLAYGGAGADTVYGDQGNDELYGGTQNDFLYGGTGRDRLYGDEGNDNLYGGTWADTLTGGDGGDFLYGGGANDVLNGDDGVDQLYGGNQSDRLFGGEGNDLLYGGEGKDRLEGGVGNDDLYGGTWSDLIFGENGDDTLYGGAGDDGLSGGNDNDTLYGGEGRDNVLGGGGNDVLYGGTWADTVGGGFGEDTLYGGGGGDTLIGGGGADVFVFDAGADTITDFEVGIDSVRVENFTSYTHAVDGGNLVLTFASGTSLTFEGITDINDVTGTLTLGGL